MKNIIKITALVIVLFIFSSCLLVSAHDMSVFARIGTDYSVWNNESGVIVPMPAPMPVPSGYYEEEIARASTDYELYATLANRNTNMTLASKSLDYTIIQSGDTFSFNEVVGMRTEERGYKVAMVFVGKEKEEGLGGGICQVSSTLYMAVKKAGFKVIERHKHSMPVTYCEREDEATVAWGSLDFKFENDTDFPVRIEASCKGGKVTIILYKLTPIYE